MTLKPNEMREALRNLNSLVGRKPESAQETTERVQDDPERRRCFDVALALEMQVLPNIQKGATLLHKKSGNLYTFEEWMIDATNNHQHYVACYRNAKGEGFVRKWDEFLDRFEVQPLTLVPDDE